MRLIPPQTTSSEKDPGKKKLMVLLESNRLEALNLKAGFFVIKRLLGLQSHLGGLQIICHITRLM
jgi:hypothetical protein